MIIFKNNGNDFSAYNEAIKWCEENGYSYGSMCGDFPIGIIKGDYYIGKWRNLNNKAKKRLDGEMKSKDFRKGDVYIGLRIKRI